MNVLFIPSVWRKRLLVLAGIGFLLSASGRVGFATSTADESEAISAAKAWIAQIDAGHYLDSYYAGCDEFHQKVTQDQWVLVLKAFRPSYGDVVSRRETSHVIKEDGVYGLDGECMVINYDTSFSRLQDGYERVVLKWEDGKWRGAGYVAGPKPTDQPGEYQPQPEVETEVQTMQTQHPPQ